LHEITEEAEGDRYGAFRGAVIYCDASDVQTERLAQAIRASGLGVSVYTMLSKHSMARRTTILDEVNQSAVAAAAVVENGSERRALPPVLLVRYRMAAVGLNFVFANHVILFQMPHRVDYLHQAVGRLVRLGQRSSKIHAWSILIIDSFEHHTYRAWKYSMTTPPNGHSTNLLSSLAQSYIFPRGPAAAPSMDEEQEEEEEEQES
jgi:superfamily II DNA/RNA helicase